MTIDKKFDPKKLLKLNNPQRLKDIPPQYVWNHLEMGKADVLVEIGAGTGLFSMAFLQEAHASKIYATDLSDIMIRWMEENIVPKHPQLIPLKTEEVKIPLGDGIADLVFMINLHHELHQANETLDEAYRLLKSSGKIFIIDWKKESPVGPPAEIRYQPEQVIEQLLNSGFNKIASYDELPMHFFVLAEKE